MGNESAFNPLASVERVRIGRGAIEVIRVDGVFLEPRRVAALGLSLAYSHDPGNFYPGFRAPLPANCSDGLRGWLAPILQREVESEQSFFSVVATASEDLLPIQCIPHYDSTDPKRFAVVIYLCDEIFPGTAFYRHRRTGYECITAANAAHYRLALNSDLRAHGLPERQYISGDTRLFETIFSNELRFNSGIVYPSGILHAARISKQFTPPRDQSEWRLTVTSLVTIR